MRKAAPRRIKEDKIYPDDSRLPQAARFGRRAVTLPGPHSTDALVRMQLEVAAYIEEISIELGAMARAAQLSSLAYFVDMTRLEAAINRRTCQLQLGDASNPEAAT
ncbi:hypothetical protein [Bosea sp. LjRoot237]|uniref:hypothetical protein n=1 Tax=Bosea sp. LjRoot237 TaxID=3342292 RepID=UPI003ECE4B34